MTATHRSDAPSQEPSAPRVTTAPDDESKADMPIVTAVRRLGGLLEDATVPRQALGSLVTIQRGAPARDEGSHYPAGFRSDWQPIWASAVDRTQGLSLVIETSPSQRLSSTTVQEERTHILRGDVLVALSEDGGIRAVAVAETPERSFAADRRLFVLRPRQLADADQDSRTDDEGRPCAPAASRFLAWSLNQKALTFSITPSNMHRGHFQSDLERLPVPMPERQRRDHIVKLVEGLERLAECEQQLANKRRTIIKSAGYELMRRAKTTPSSPATA